jgi:hypothetical protein
MNDQLPSRELTTAERLREWADSNMRGKYGPGLLRIAADELEQLKPAHEPGSLRPGLERAIEIVSKLDTFTEPGGTGSGLLGAEESTSYVNAFRDHVVDKLDAAIGEPEPTPPPFSVGDEVEWRGHKGVVVSTEQRVSVCLSFKYTHDIPIADLKRLGPTKVSAT